VTARTGLINIDKNHTLAPDSTYGVLNYLSAVITDIYDLIDRRALNIQSFFAAGDRDIWHYARFQDTLENVYNFAVSREKTRKYYQNFSSLALQLYHG